MSSIGRSSSGARHVFMGYRSSWSFHEAQLVGRMEILDYTVYGIYAQDLCVCAIYTMYKSICKDLTLTTRLPRTTKHKSSPGSIQVSTICAMGIARLGSMAIRDDRDRREEIYLGSGRLLRLEECNHPSNRRDTRVEEGLVYQSELCPDQWRHSLSCRDN